MRFGQVGLKLGGFAVGFRGFYVSPHANEDVAEIVAGAGVPRADRDHLLEKPEALFGTPLPVPQDAQEMQRVGGLRLYKTALPLFLGLILGEMIIGCIWSIIGISFNIPYFNFWGA